MKPWVSRRQKRREKRRAALMASGEVIETTTLSQADCLLNVGGPWSLAPGGLPWAWVERGEDGLWRDQLTGEVSAALPEPHRSASFGSGSPMFGLVNETPGPIPDPE